MNLGAQDPEPPPLDPLGETETTPSLNGGYDGVFWMTYIANSAMMVAVSVLFRYADFVHQAGGTDLHLGLIVGAGTVGALAMRVFQGVGIDRFGSRSVWLLSLALFVTSMLAHTAIDTVHGPAVYLARILTMTSLAGAFGASITFISLRVPARRMAEMIGSLGSSGFIGIAVGPTLGDLLFGGGPVTWEHVHEMFWLSALMGVISLGCAFVATRGQLRRTARRHPPVWSVLRRYHPGIMLVVAMGVGWGVGIPNTFLRPYAAGLHIAGLKTFFLVYALTAFCVRIATRNVPERYGLRPMILAGFGCLSLSMVLFLVVSSEWLLIVPALAAGTGHALLFPPVTAGGCSSFPTRYRGLATTLMLAMYDSGSLVGQPLVGGVLEFCKWLRWPPYPTMFVSMAVAMLAFVAVYEIVARTRDSEVASGKGFQRI